MPSFTNLRRDSHWIALEGTRLAIGDQSTTSAPKVRTDGVRYTDQHSIRMTATGTWGITNPNDIRMTGIAFEEQEEDFVVYRIKGHIHLLNPPGAGRVFVAVMSSGSYSASHENGIDLSVIASGVEFVEIDDALAVPQYALAPTNPVVFALGVHANSAISSTSYNVFGELSVQKLSRMAEEVNLAIT